MNLFKTSIGLLSLVAITANAGELGMKAPPLHIEKWVKGEPLHLNQPGGENAKITVVEFWATWCGPCIRGIPHLTEIQKTYADKGVRLVGISDEKASRVEPFVEKMGAKMDYTVAVDNGGATKKAYKAAIPFSGIPHAFVVDSGGAILWSGHPMSNMEKVLDQVLAGTYDIELAKKVKAASMKVNEYFFKARANVNAADLAILGKEIVEGAGTDSDVMNRFAWGILTYRGIASRDKPLAQQAAKLAMDATEGKNPAILDTYALALFENGNQKDAVVMQKKAIELLDPKTPKTSYETRLKRYQEAATE